MEDKQGYFDGWSLQKKLGFGLGLAAILAVVVLLAWWAQRTPKAVLFSDLAERDAAVIAAELDKLKQPYSLSEDGHAILVGADSVHRTRMALMGKQLPLHGAVGFELFNNADFGVSDFVQKVNYQRALQGELTRTILAIDQVQDARVHLALPDQALFRKDGPKGKASVTVSLKGGQSLSGDQVVGIQRLLAASVPEIKAEDVTVLDQHGVVLSRAGGDDAALPSGQLDARQSLETHLTRKVARLLDQMFTPGDSMVAVDVVLNHEQSRITTEEVLGSAQAERGSQPAGVIVRERSVTKEPLADAGGTASSAQVLTQETDYLTGKRVAQTVSQGGQIARLNVAVVVKRSLGEAELARVRQVVATAIGLQTGRGDVVTVHSMSDLGAAAAFAAAPAVSDTAPTRAVPQRGAAAPAVHGEARGSATVAKVLGIVMAGLVLGLCTLWWRRRRSLELVSATLSPREREALLAKLQHWLEPQS